MGTNPFCTVKITQKSVIRGQFYVNKHAISHCVEESDGVTLKNILGNYPTGQKHWNKRSKTSKISRICAH